jgi:predicted RNA-binding Zn-ribbon protein involved in translation (DUF1610 family)
MSLRDLPSNGGKAINMVWKRTSACFGCAKSLYDVENPFWTGHGKKNNGVAVLAGWCSHLCNASWVATDGGCYGEWVLSMGEVSEEEFKAARMAKTTSTAEVMNNHTCPSCGNTGVSKSEKSCWLCGNSLHPTV